MLKVAKYEPLGIQRLRLIDCIVSYRFWAPDEFNPAEESDLFQEYSTFVDRMAEKHREVLDPYIILLVAAARVLNGDAAAARIILDHLPAQPFITDHGAGYCLIAPLQALRACMPLPAHLTSIMQWTAGSSDVVQLRSWFDANERQLSWDKFEAKYFLPGIGVAALEVD